MGSTGPISARRRRLFRFSLFFVGALALYAGEWISCHTCGGSGHVMATCSGCNGIGGVLDPCTACNGTGANSGGGPCNSCAGNGNNGWITHQDCGGTGTATTECGACNGAGSIWVP